MKTRTLVIVAAALTAALSGLAQAQPSPQAKEAMRERVQQMTPEERAAMKEKMRQRWESMTPEEREAAKKRFAERHPDGVKRGPQRGAGPAAPAAPASAGG
jgi:hypothetical protein